MGNCHKTPIVPIDDDIIATDNSSYFITNNTITHCEIDYIYIFSYMKNKDFNNNYVKNIFFVIINRHMDFCNSIHHNTECKINNMFKYIIKESSIVIDINFKFKETCYICCEKIDKGIMLKCGHYYHKECINKWFDQNKYSCPLCRSKIRLYEN